MLSSANSSTSYFTYFMYITIIFTNLAILYFIITYFIKRRKTKQLDPFDDVYYEQLIQ